MIPWIKNNNNKKKKLISISCLNKYGSIKLVVWWPGHKIIFILILIQDWRTHGWTVVSLRLYLHYIWALPAGLEFISSTHLNTILTIVGEQTRKLKAINEELYHCDWSYQLDLLFAQSISCKSCLFWNVIYHLSSHNVNSRNQTIIMSFQWSFVL